MSDQQHIYPVRDDIAAKAWADKDTYQAMYQRSVDDPDGFWAEQARQLEWFKAPSVIKNTSFASNNVDIRWFEDGKLNASVNCLDRHLASRGDRPAIIWEATIPPIPRP